MSIVKVNINGRDLELECGLGQEDALVNLSYELDRRIKQNAQVFGDTNTNLLFVMTSLQLLDELNDVRNGTAPAVAAAPTAPAVDLDDEIGRNTVATLSQISGRIEEMAQIISRKAG